MSAAKKLRSKMKRKLRFYFTSVLLGVSRHCKDKARLLQFGCNQRNSIPRRPTTISLVLSIFQRTAGIKALTSLAVVQARTLFLFLVLFSGLPDWAKNSNWTTFGSH